MVVSKSGEVWKVWKECGIFPQKVVELYWGMGTGCRDMIESYHTARTDYEPHWVYSPSLLCVIGSCRGLQIIFLDFVVEGFSVHSQQLGSLALVAIGGFQGCLYALQLGLLIA